MFRVLCAAGLAAFAWKHRRNSVLVFLTILSVPALFLLQKFFGYMDNFMTLALLAGVLILLDRMPDSWSARVAVTLFMFVGGMSHPTTLVIFLAAMGAVAVYRLLRERSLLAALRSEGLIVATGTVAVVMTAAFWLGGCGGRPRASPTPRCRRRPTCPTSWSAAPACSRTWSPSSRCSSCSV